MIAPLTTIAELSPDWLNEALFPDGGDCVVSVASRPIGAGLIGSTSLVSFRTAGGDEGAVVVKLSSPDPAVVAEALALGLYAREVGFYTHAAPRCGMRVPHCYYAQVDQQSGASTIVMEAIPDATAGDQIAGIGPDLAEVCVRELALLHSVWWQDPQMAEQPWLARRNRAWALARREALARSAVAVEQRLGKVLSAEQLDVLRAFDGAAAVRFHTENESRPHTLVHNDYRPDNLLYTGDGGVVAVDFQTVSWAPACTDLAYFIQSGLTIEHRREHERHLVETYHAVLSDKVTDYDLATCWGEYRRQVYAPITILLLALVAAERNERGDRMMQQWAQRLTTAAIDLGVG